MEKCFIFIEHLNVRGEMGCNREDPDAVYNIIRGELEGYIQYVRVH